MLPPSPPEIRGIEFPPPIEEDAPVFMERGLIYSEAPGTPLQIRGGSLCVRPPSGSAKLFRPADHTLQCIILAAPGSISTDALAWCTREHVGLIVARDGFELTSFGDALSSRLARREITLRRRQMECVFDPEQRVAAARAIVANKLGTLDLEPLSRRAFAGKLLKARSMQDVLACEAEHAACYWRRWRGFELRFKGDAPDNWRTFETRTRSWRTGRLGEKERQFSNRFALHPINVMLNYSGAIIVAQCARACAGLGFDPAWGVLHSEVPGRASLAWDVYELLRTMVEASIFKFAVGRTFSANEFRIVNEPKPHLRFGNAGAGAPLAREIAVHVMRRVPFADCVKSARKVAALF